MHHGEEGHAETDHLTLRNIVETYPDNVDVVWRYARVCHKYSDCITDSNMKKNIILAGTYNFTLIYVYILMCI